MKLVDVLWRYPDLDDQGVGNGHNEHQHLAGLDDAADRVHRALEDLAVLGRHEIDAPGWSSAATRFSTSSDFLPRISASSLPTPVRRSSSICRILSRVSAIRPRAWAMAAMSTPRSPCKRAASRSSVVKRLNGTRFWFHNPRMPTSSCCTQSISLDFAPSCSTLP